MYQWMHSTETNVFVMNLNLHYCGEDIDGYIDILVNIEFTFKYYDVLRRLNGRITLFAQNIIEELSGDFS